MDIPGLFSGCQGAERSGNVPGTYLHLHRYLRTERFGRRHLHRRRDSGIRGSFCYEASSRKICPYTGIQRTVLRRPDLGDRVHRRCRHRRTPHGHKNVLPLFTHLTELRNRSGAELNGSLVHQTSGKLQEILCQDLHRVLIHPV